MATTDGDEARFAAAASGAVLVPPGLASGLGAASSLDDVLMAFLAAVRDVAGADRATVVLLTTGGDHLKLHGLEEESVIATGTAIPVMGSISGRAITERRTVIVDELSDVTSIEGPRLIGAGLRSVACVPLIGGDGLLGAINMGSRQPNYFNAAGLGPIETMANLLASYVAVHQAAHRGVQRHSLDELTSVLSRAAVLETLREACARETGDAAVLYVDLDGFKLINDNHGHAAGDRVLQEIAHRFARQLRAHDTIGRLGGDEFLIVLEPGTNEHTLRTIAQRLLDKCCEPVDLGVYSVSVGVSVGAATAAAPSSAPDLMVKADLAMYHAKRSEESPVVIADESIARQAELLATVDREIEAAMANDHLGFHYQPIRDLRTMEILGAEALLRWFHPIHGPIPPSVIIDRLEALNLDTAYSEWTVHTAAADLAKLRRAVPTYGDKAFAVNLTPRQLGWSGYAEEHAAVLERHALRPMDLIVEVVDSELVEVGTATEQTLQTLADNNCTIALDDFGTGHNGLGYFAQFPVHAIKFDETLIQAVATSKRARALIRGLSQVASELDIYTLAEGIERPDQVETSLALGIGKGQGDHLGRPMPLEDLADLCRREFSTRRSLPPID